MKSFKLSQLAVLFSFLIFMGAVWAEELTPANASHFITFTCAGVQEGTTLENFPVLVRLSETLVEGFKYEHVQNASQGDLMFLDANGNALAHEIEQWDTTGESDIWVKVPTLVKGTTFTLYYGSTTATHANTPADVWSKYVGVWHLADSNLKDSCGSNTGSLVGTASVADTSGLIGGGLAATKGNMITAKPKVSTISQISISGWMKPSANGNNVRIFSTKSNYQTAGLELVFAAGTGLLLRGDFDSKNTYPTVKWNVNNQYAFPTDVWTHYAGVWNGTTGTIYMNAVNKASGSIGAISGHAGDVFGFGGTGKRDGDSGNSLQGSADELRIYNGVASAEWIKEEYDSVSDADYLTNASAEATSSETLILSNAALARGEDGAYTVSAQLTSGTADTVKCVATASDGMTVETALSTTDTANPKTYSAALSGLAANTTYTYVVRAEAEGRSASQTTGSEVFYTGELAIVKTGDANEDGLVPGTIVISRADAGEALAVAYEVGDTATTASYNALSGSVTIPEGEQSVTLSIVPKNNFAVQEDMTVTVTLAAGNYSVPSTANSATVTIANLALPNDRYNVWIAPMATNASDAANWSRGHCPTEDEAVLFDGRFGNYNCSWDVKAGTTIGSLTITNGYTKTVAIATTFDDTFPVFTVNGDVLLSSGYLSPRSHGNAYTTEKYRLNLAIGGNLFLLRESDSNVGKISASAMGRWSGSSLETGYYYRAPYGGDAGVISNSTSVAWIQPGSRNLAYGSIFSPTNAAPGAYIGTDSDDKKSNGGGAIRIAVAGDFVNNGAIGADGGVSLCGAGAGGSVYITANTISGTGSINARGAKASKTDSYASASAGGRIALVATGRNDITISNIGVEGAVNKLDNNYLKNAGSAGTIYLSGSNTNLVQVKSSGTDNTFVSTSIPAQAEEVEAFKDVDLGISVYAFVRLTTNLRCRNFCSAGSANRLDLNGHNLRVKQAFIGGVEIKRGIYKVAAGASNETYPWLLNTSSDSAGELVVGQTGLSIMVR